MWVGGACRAAARVVRRGLGQTPAAFCLRPDSGLPLRLASNLPRELETALLPDLLIDPLSAAPRKPASEPLTHTLVELLLLLAAETPFAPTSGPHSYPVGGVAPGVAPLSTLRGSSWGSIAG
jgi:hypothetical protein